MREGLDILLCRKYPSIFRDRHKDSNESCMGRGFEVGDGWYRIIDELCAKLQLLEGLGVFPIASQVKEKVGMFRFYFRLEFDQKWNEQQQLLWREIVSDCCRGAESQSEYTCEECGSPGNRRAGKLNNVQTLCDDCGGKAHAE